MFITKLKISQVTQDLGFDSTKTKTNFSNIDKDTWDWISSISIICIVNNTIYNTQKYLFLMLSLKSFALIPHRWNSQDNFSNTNSSYI